MAIKICRMQSFDTFKTIFAFLVRSVLDNQYVDDIDTAVEQGSVSDETTRLISDVRAFHKMRQTLCMRVFMFFQKDDVLQQLCRAHGVVQYNCVPQGALCAMTGVLLTKSQGCMLILNPIKDPTSLVVHARFKLLLYNFWYLVHFTDEIMLDVRGWMSKQTWWRRGSDIKYEDVLKRITTHGNGTFVKKHYVKLKGITQHIQNAMAQGPINQTNPSDA